VSLTELEIICPTGSVFPFSLLVLVDALDFLMRFQKRLKCDVNETT